VTAFFAGLTSVIDYAAIDLPVFTCSSRDYVRLTGASMVLIPYITDTHMIDRSSEG